MTWVPPDCQLTHVGFYVSNHSETVAFYQRVLGMVVTDTGIAGGRDWAFLSRNPEEHHQLVLGSGRSEKDERQINQISFRVADLESLRRFHAYLAQEQVDGLDAVTHGNAWSVYFHDPDGNRVELYASSPWYVRQPMRTPVDMTRSVEALLEEADALTRDDPSRIPMEQWSRELGRLIAAPHENR